MELLLTAYLKAEIAHAPRFSKQRRDDIARLRLLAHGTDQERQAIFTGLAVRRLAPVEERSWWQRRQAAKQPHQSPWGRRSVGDYAAESAARKGIAYGD